MAIQSDRKINQIGSDPLKSVWKWIAVALMVYTIYGAFFIAKGAVNFVGKGDVARIVFFHVPVAVLSSFCYLAGATYALLYFFKGNSMSNDAKSSVCMELGLMASILATITGSIFAGAQWGSYWNWDPREISIVGVLLLFAAYLLLRGSVPDAIKKAQLSTAFTIITLVPANFLLWVVPRIKSLGTLHPTTVLTDASSTSPSYKLVGLAAFLGFTMLFVWLFQLRLRVLQLQDKHLKSF